MRSDENIARDIDRGCKACTVCGTLKEFDEYHNQVSSPDGKASACMRCKAAVRRAVHLKHKYNMTEATYVSMIEAQEGNCAICGSPDETISGNLAVDHCHETDKVRGLLCSNCNKGLGLLQDSIQVLSGAIRYLDKFKLRR